MTKTNKLIHLGAASVATKGTLFPVAPIDNRGQYKPDTMGLLQD
jgi:hypothetical protein